MLKRERLSAITKLVRDKGIVSNAEIAAQLHVSDMTIRRDLDELEQDKKLIRIHGGAQSPDYTIDHELSHKEKATVQVDQKSAIARYAAGLIKAHETVFIGPGTTMELLAAAIQEEDVRVVTNSLPAFNNLSPSLRQKALLIGGEYRENTGCFIGVLALSNLSNLNFSRAFISCNGVLGEDITTSSMEEGQLQAAALKNAKFRCLVIDAHKFNREDFYTYYRLYNIDQLITDDTLSPDILEPYEDLVQIVQVTGSGSIQIRRQTKDKTTGKAVIAHKSFQTSHNPAFGSGGKTK